MTPKYVALSDVCNFLDNRRKPITAKDRKPGPYPYYGANGVLDYVDDWLFDEELVLLAEDGGFFDEPERGVAYRISGKSWVNNHAHVLQPRENIDVDYLGYILRMYDVRPFVTGATVKKITQRSARSLTIPLVSLAKQRQIARMLGRADLLRQKRKEAIGLLDDYLASSFIELFGDPIPNLKELREIHLSEVAEIRSGVTKGRKLDASITVEVPYMRVANVQDGYISLDEVKTISVLPNDVEKYRLEDGDILLTEGGDPDKLGRGGVWRNSIKDCIHQNHIFRVRLDQSRVLPEYASALVGSPYGKRYFLRAAKQTTGIATINSTQLKKFPFLLADMNLQKLFAAKTQAIAEIRKTMIEQSLELDNQFNALMQKAFNGEL